MDESSLIAAARQGDVPAFNRLVLAYQGLAYNVAFRILGDSDAAADATQEAFLSAFKALGAYRGGSFKAWLLRIVTNACYDQMRARQRRPSTPLDDMTGEDDEGEPREFVNGAEGPENHALRHELGRLIQRGVLTLPADQRITLVLSDVQGLSYEEIAEATDANVGTVKSRLSRARARLRDYLLAEQELLPARYRLRDG
jgi:RNA polymerase sigma factor (sigma-70 family)